MWHYIKAVSRCWWNILYTYFYAKRTLKRKDRYSEEERYIKVRKLLKKVNKSLDAEFHVEGLENLPKEPFALFSNHVSMMDPVIYIDILEHKTSVVAKKELRKAPFVPPILECIDGKFLDRDDLKQSLKIMMSIQDDLASKNYNWLIFPEGTRNKDNKKTLLEFHHGTFRPAFKSHAPIVPAVIYGTREFMALKPIYKRYPIFVKFLKPLYYEDYKDMDTASIAKLVQSMIQRELTFTARSWHHHYMVTHYPKKYKL